MKLESFLVQESSEALISKFLEKCKNNNPLSYTGAQSNGCTPLPLPLCHPHPVELLEFLIKGKQTIVITGTAGSGKTTLMTALIELIEPNFNIKTSKENVDYLSKLYPSRNILGLEGPFERPANVSGYKSDGHVSVFDENGNWDSIFVNQSPWTIFSIFTHYGKELSHVVASLRDSFLQKGLFSNEKDAEQLVVNVVDFNIHVVRDKGGSRYIERITECVPFSLPNGEQLYEARDILRFNEGSYIAVNPISPQRQKDMKLLTAQDHNDFQEFIKTYWTEQVY